MVVVKSSVIRIGGKVGGAFDIISCSPPSIYSVFFKSALLLAARWLGCKQDMRLFPLCPYFLIFYYDQVLVNLGNFKMFKP